jgi:hypothetical protein
MLSNLKLQNLMLSNLKLQNLMLSNLALPNLMLSKHRLSALFFPLLYPAFCIHFFSFFTTFCFSIFSAISSDFLSIIHLYLAVEKSQLGDNFCEKKFFSCPSGAFGKKFFRLSCVKWPFRSNFWACF